MDKTPFQKLGAIYAILKGIPIENKEKVERILDDCMAKLNGLNFRLADTNKSKPIRLQ